ncbi:putative transposase [Streptomyces noursei ATCC 11455]|uniref:IS701 family transposase n=1 Tax=Streptomyces noursei TaxID=1971 RepID=UPI00081CA49A|nr:putative transposase [Streptomyces noursei ATCC 11455]
MNQAVALSLRDSLGQHVEPARAEENGEGGSGCADLRAALFSVLRRSDQRKKADQYLSGLLTTQGRKSIRNIATLQGGTAAEQSLHHFISRSTWDWQPMRAALASFMECVATQQAWVVQSLPIAKSGTQSVGVGRQLIVDRGQMMNGQLAHGAWFASEELSVPVGWRLFLPPSWLDDQVQRSRAEIPRGVGEATPWECAIATGLEAVQAWGLSAKPVVLDVEVSDPGVAARSFAKAGVPLLMRIDDRTRLVPADSARSGSGLGSLTARRILESVKGQARPVVWTHPVVPGVCRTTLAVAVPVRLARSGAGPQPTWLARRSVLLGEWHDDLRRGPARIWLADLPDTWPSSPGRLAGSLLRLVKLAEKVGRDVERVGDRLGLRDFEGRSFPGWHRHMTLASAAHAEVVLHSGPGESWSSDRSSHKAFYERELGDPLVLPGLSA